jgi:hypothetical protein
LREPPTKIRGVREVFFCFFFFRFFFFFFFFGFLEREGEEETSGPSGVG